MIQNNMHECAKGPVTRWQFSWQLANAILLLRDAKLVTIMFDVFKGILANCGGNVYLPIFTSTKSKNSVASRKKKLHRVTGP